jgi:hypothetical protein
MLRRFMIPALACVLTPWIVSGDQLVVGGATHEGTFDVFSNGTIQFRSDKWKNYKEQPTRVTRLTVTASNQAKYLTSEKKEVQTAVFKGFEKLKFIFEKDGQAIMVHHTKMKKIEIEREEEDEATIQAVDIAPLEKALADGILTDAQKASLSSYKEIRAKYDEFVGKSEALIKEMDRSTGAHREALLNELRKRKQDEQPLKQEMWSATSALMLAFPQQAPK